ncbi:protein TASOR isoform X2 [Anguilla anguilla]|uniref:protein TASOR isoform X2 n=1 Tax=Anguilla anguilla TaxID=7936 RepID=UPI0015B21AAA|nr:protein TASOR isoform X2 [Anguilla anguilla]
MASNLNMERQQSKGADRRHSGDVPAESCDILKHLLPAAVASSQDGEQAVCEGLASEQEATERRRSGVSELRHNSSPSAYQRPLDELPRLNFQIPRKSKERKALFQYLSQGSREFEDVGKILSSCYRDASSAGTFSYTKARLVHSELLEKDFIEKKREMKQDGRTDKELVESYCFLLPDASKLHWICEKGLSVGHTRITTLGNPAMGVYLSKYSDLLQINTFDLGATGDIIIFKVMKGKVKSIYENMSKNLLDPTPKFDCHVSKNAARVTSLLSYRGFELTQQYFYEYSFDDIKHRPRHVCPYAVVSFLYKGKEATPPPKPTAPLRSNCSISEGSKARSSYTVWSGQLLNGGRVVYQVGLRSSTRPFLPFKLPEKLEIGTVMNLEQVKRKIPTVLFSWDTYTGEREVLKSGMYCSLFEVVDKSKHGNSLTALLQKLERERMVLVNTLLDKGFLFLLSSTQMVNSNERRGGWTRCLQALFVFQESRGVTKFTSKRPTAHEPLQPDPQHPIMPQLDTFIPALHYALMKVRSNPPADLGAGVERQARDYLSGRDDGKVRLYYMNEYKQNLDERDKLHPAPKQKHNLEAYLRSYIYRPDVYLLAVVQAREMVESLRRAPEYSPVSDWEGSDGQGPGATSAGAAAQANGAHGAQADNDPEKMRELLKLIQMWKRNEGEARQVGEARDGREGPEEPIWEARGLKRKLEEEAAAAASTFKYLRRASLDNGEHSREEEGRSPPSLSAVMNCMGIRDTDLRKDQTHNTSRLMEMLATLSKAKRRSSAGPPDGPISPEGGAGGGAREGPELSEPLRYDTMIKLDLPSGCDIDLRDQAGEDDLEDQTAGSMSSLEVFSPCSSNEQRRGGDNEGQMPWFLIPITGIKSEKYCRREEDNPQDPRFLNNPLASSYSAAEKPHTSLSQPPEDSYLTVGGEVEEMEVEEEAAALVEGGSEPLCPLGRDVPPGTLDGIIDEALGHFSVGMRDILREGRVSYSPEPTPIPLEQHQQLWAPGVAFSEYISHYTSSVPIHGYVTTLCEQMSCLARPKERTAPADALTNRAGVQDTDLRKDQTHNTSRLMEMLTTLSKAKRRSSAPVPPDTPPHTSTHVPVPDLTPSHTPTHTPAHTCTPIPTHTPVPAHTPTHTPAHTSTHTPTHAPVPAHTPTHTPAHTSTHTSTHAPVPAPTPAHSSTHSPVPAHISGVPPVHTLVPAPAPAAVPSPHSDLAPAHVPLAPALGPVPAPSSSPCTAPPPAKSWDSPPHRQAPHSLPRLGTIKDTAPLTPKAQGVHRRPPRQDGGRAVAEVEPDGKHPTPLTEAPPTSSLPPDSGSASGPAAISSLISQLKPEVFSSLVEIIKDVQKNAVKFYIHSQEDSAVCLEIKEYLIRLGNVECNPQAFLESKNNLDKLLIIIQNEDIAAHVHKIPALVSLKKLPAVSFAGVDSLDDVKNHTYNELFVSGGFIVSDEFVLNPDFITHERLLRFLKLLEKQSSPENLWQWKVHCKTQKKLKELGRLNSDALSLLTLLTTYQKKHLVEFLPYHECDAPSRHAPDLDCLIRLQAQHTQHRHILFLTERRFEMFPHYSSNGIVIASIDDVMNSFHSLIGFHDNAEEPPASDNHSPQTPPAVLKDECVEEEDMSLDSEDDAPVIEEPSAQSQEVGAEGVAQQPPLPQIQEFRPPLPEQEHLSFLQACSGEGPKPLDFAALKSAISQFKASGQGQPPEYEVGGSSPGAFNVNPHQSFLCPSLLPTSYQGAGRYAGPPPYPSSPCSVTQEPALGPGQDDVRSAAGPAPSQDRTSHAPGSTALGPQGLVATATSGAGGAQHGWGHVGGVSSACGTPTSQDDGALGPALDAPRGNSASGTPNSQGGATPSSAGFSAQGPARTANQAGGSTPSSQGSQGSLTPVPSKVAEKAAAPTPAPAPARGGAHGSGLLPFPHGVGSVNGRGRGGGPGPVPFDCSWGNGAVGYRGLPPGRSRPRGCRELRGGPCIRGFPQGRGRGHPGGYYTDFTQDTYLSWGEEHWSPGDGYGTHRDGYNGW